MSNNVGIVGITIFVVLASGILVITIFVVLFHFKLSVAVLV